MGVSPMLGQPFSPSGPSSPSPAKPTPVKPTPAKPRPVKPTPAKPTPAKPTPAKPTPVKPTPAKPTPAKPTPGKLVKIIQKCGPGQYVNPKTRRCVLLKNKTIQELLSKGYVLEDRKSSTYSASRTARTIYDKTSS